MLGYNMLQWLCGKLPWEDTNNPEYIHFQKNGFMSNIPVLMLRCFPDSEPPAVLSQYLQHVASLGFETMPDYAYCRTLLRQGIEDSGCVNDGKLVFGDSPLAGVTENNGRGIKRKATEDPENIAELNPKKRICNILQQPCASNRTPRNSPTSSVLPPHQHFSLKKIIPGNPKKQVMKHGTLNHKLPTNMLANSEQVVSNSVLQKFTAPTKPWQQTADTSSICNPTPAMLEIMSKKRQKASTPAAHRGGMCRAREPVWPSKEVHIMIPGDCWLRKEAKGRKPTKGQCHSRQQP
jgi:vaccinia related kinase